MTQHCVGIIVPPQHLDDYENYVAEQLAPYDDTITFTYEREPGQIVTAGNPQGRWLSYEINGLAHGWTANIVTVEQLLQIDPVSQAMGANYVKLPGDLITPDGVWHAEGPLSYRDIPRGYLGHYVVFINVAA